MPNKYNNDDYFSRSTIISDDVKKDLSNITERTEDRSSSSHHSDHARPSRPSNQGGEGESRDIEEERGLGAGSDRELKCLRCRSPIGLTLA